MSHSLAYSMDMEVKRRRVNPILGQAVATFAKRHLPDLIKSSPAFKEQNYRQALTDAFLSMDKQLITPEGNKELEEINMINPSKYVIPVEEASTRSLAHIMGCTACVALITKSEIYVANAGDSRCVLSKKGSAVALSEDHKPDLLTEMKRIEEAGGSVIENRVNGGINLSRSFGDIDYKLNPKRTAEEQMVIASPDVAAEKIDSDAEFLILACDGIWECMSSQEAVGFVRNGMEKLKTGKLSSVLESLFAKIIAGSVEESGKRLVLIMCSWLRM